MFGGIIFCKEAIFNSNLFREEKFVNQAILLSKEIFEFLIFIYLVIFVIFNLQQATLDIYIYIYIYIFYSNEAIHQRTALDDNYNTTG